jgi:Fe-S-cluster containining protein
MDKNKLDTILQECRQCGTCCKTYKKVLLEEDEIETLKKLGANVGYMVNLNDLRTSNINDLAAKEKEKHKMYMIHPDNKGCIFLQKRNDKYYCKIYHYRPRACRGFKCNMADESVNTLFMQDSIYLLGQDRFGRNLS